MMKREKQYDMFDVATGACTLEDYLFQRYSENDLSSTFWIEESDEVDELRAPKPTEDGQPGTEPEVIPIQGPRAPKRDSGLLKPPPLPIGLEPDKPTVAPVPESAVPASPSGPDSCDSLVTGPPASEVSGLETFKSTPVQQVPANDIFTQSPPDNRAESPVQEPVVPEPEAAPSAPSMAELLAQFHKATQDYQQRAQVEPDPEDSQDS